MKKFEIVINGAYEEEIGLEIMQGIYAAIQNHGYTDVSVKADTVTEQVRDLQIPDFLKTSVKAMQAQHGKQRRG